MEQQRIQIQNELISNIFGSFDENIKKIENAYSVNIINRGDDILISGEGNSINKASQVLNALISLAESGETIQEQNINYLIAEAEDDNLTAAKGIQDDFICMTMNGRALRPKTLGQKKYIDAIRNNTVVFGIGPAGTGKTYLAMAMAITAFKHNEVDRIILTRPAIEAGENLGFLPGDLQQKLNPYLRPLYDAMEYVLTPSQIKRLEESGAVEIAPLAYMRGRSVNNAVMILDEAQNATKSQMRMFLTRLGENSQAIATGDPSQIDLPHSSDSGLIEAIETLDGIHGVSVIRFSHNDTVRSRIVREIVKAYTDKGRREGDEQSGF